MSSLQLSLKSNRATTPSHAFFYTLTLRQPWCAGHRVHLRRRALPILYAPLDHKQYFCLTRPARSRSVLARVVLARLAHISESTKSLTREQSPYLASSSVLLHGRAAVIAVRLAIFIAATAIVVVVALAVIILIQDRIVYKPSSVSKGDPADFGMQDFDDIEYRASDGVRVRGWLIKQTRLDDNPPATVPTVIYFHGRDKNASFRLKKVAGLYKALRCNVLLVSYRGYGNSQARFPTERGMCMDAESAVEFLLDRDDIDRTNLWVFGESLGGAVAIHVADKYGDVFRGLILENTFTSLLDMIDKRTPYFRPLKSISRNRWPSSLKIVNVRLPILFLSGLRDSFIPPTMMRQLYDKAALSRHKELVTFPGGTHNRTWTMLGYFSRIANFVSSVTRLASAPVGQPTGQPTS
mmetsp:Transcript_4271/g.8374  ORF Transcript_4271/g.8374 Transcript_4271/m.8374 type:complete len:409 (-) Transcript_4271:3028-4254(-)